MKKSLVALAVMAVSGIASAQSSVTLYGIVDAWVGSAKSTGSVRQVELGDGALSGSRFGFKGTEDLGGGLKANFVLEQGFNVDTGARRGPWPTVAAAPPVAPVEMFSRVATVGFSGGFGEVKVGKTYTAYDDINGAAHPAFDSAFSPTGVWASNGYKFNLGNTLYYGSPDMGGFSGAFSYSLGENKTATVKAGNVTAGHIKYSGGPLYVGLAYQTEKETGAAARVNFTRLNTTYDFGAAKLLVGYGRVKVANMRSTDWSLGADVPLSSAAKVSFGYARSTDNGAAGGNRANGIGIAGIYSLSKRTDLYAGVTSATTRARNNAVEDKSSFYAAGVRHSF